MSHPNPPHQSSRTLLWQAVKQAQPGLSDQEVDALLLRASTQERNLVLKHGLSLDRARELANQDLFPATLDPWAGDEAYGPMPGEKTPASNPTSTASPKKTP